MVVLAVTLKKVPLKEVPMSWVAGCPYNRFSKYRKFFHHIMEASLDCLGDMVTCLDLSTPSLITVH